MTDTFAPATAPAHPGTNQSGMRAQNERLVLTLLRRQGAMAKADIARATGLSAQTVSVIMRALEADGLLLKGARQKGRVGQPSVPMALNPDGVFFLGLKVGRRSTEMILTDFVGTIRAHKKMVYHYPDFDQVLAFALDASTLLQVDLPEGRLGGLGIALPNYLWSWARRIGVDPDEMTTWAKRDLAQELRDATGLAVYQQNDATSACSAELVFGQEALPAHFLHLYIGFFVGGGLVFDRSLFTGATGNAAGMGTLIVPDRAGAMQPLIDHASLAQLEARLRAKGLDEMMLWEKIDTWSLPADCLEPWLADTAFALTGAIHASQGILDLDAVLIDGWFPTDLRDTLVARVRTNLAQMDLTGVSKPQIKAGTIGPAARALGAASLPLSDRWLS